MTQAGRKRPWLAAVLALAYPGLGHLYLRSWLRSMLWFGLVMSAVFVLLPEAAVQPADGPRAALASAWEAMQVLPLRTKGLLGVIVAMEAFDAYMLALRGRTTDGESCPHCGKDLEDLDELDFCHWCSGRLDG